MWAGVPAPGQPIYFDTPVQQISTVAVAAICGFAIWRGGRVERLAAAATLLGWMATPWVESRVWRGVQVGVFAVDLAYVAVLLWIAFTSDRWWPLFASAFQVLNLAMHLAAVVDNHLRARAYYIGMEISSYLVLAALAAGAVLESGAAAKRTMSEPPQRSS